MNTIKASEDKQNTNNNPTQADTDNTSPREGTANNPSGTLTQGAAQPDSVTTLNLTPKNPEPTKPNDSAFTGGNADDDKNKNINPEELRRLVIVSGDKGGVGKSTAARGIAQMYLDHAVRFVGLDADNSNPHLIRFYGASANILTLDISNSDKLDEFLDNLKELVYPNSKGDGKTGESQSLILLETPSQFLPTIEILFKEMGFLGVVNNKCKMRVTIVVVISTIVDCINQLLKLYSFCGDNVDYVIVKNLFYGEPEQFTFYDNSPEIKKISQQVKAGGHQFVSINMPKLAKKSYDYLDVNNMTFRQGLEQDEYPSVYGRVLSWLNNFKGQIKPIKTLFGIKEFLP